jgi:HEAT repeat protein
MRTAVPLVAALLLSACPAPTDPNTAAYWIYKLDDKRERSEALKQLGRLGDKSALPHVLKWFEEEGDWQPDAAYALGQLGSSQTAAKLEAGLQFAVSGRDRRARNKNRTNVNIVRALAMLGATGSVPTMVKLLDSREATVREATIKSLGKLGSPVAVDPLIAAARRDEEPFLRKTAIQALGDIADPKAIAVLIEMLFDEASGASFYHEARYSLIQMGDAAVPPLMDALQRKNKVVEGMGLADGAVEAKAGSVLGYLGAAGAEPFLIGALNRLYRTYGAALKARKPVAASVAGERIST